MQSRETRFVLRIESGERQGDEVALGEGTLQVGRKPECGLVLKDASVSGKHAELRVSGAKVELVDLGSTNGTRVGGERIEQTQLSAGDEVVFGNIRARLRDAAGAPAPGFPGAPSGAAALLTPSAAGDASGALGHVSADKVTRAARGSKRPMVLVGLVVLLGGGAFAYFQFLRPGGQAKPRAVIPSVPGNLLADGSFEGDRGDGTSEWVSAESAPAAFLRERGYARSGDVGLGARLDEGAEGGASWSLVRSPEFPLHARRSLVCAGSLRVDDGALGRIGVELASATGALPPFVAWQPARPAAGAFADFELAFDVPGGYDRARLVVAGTGRGSVAVDDLSALEKEPLGGAAKFTEYELSVLGQPGSSALFVRSGRPILTGFDLSAWASGAPEGWASAELSVQAGPRGFQLAFPGAPADASLRFTGLRPDESAPGQSPESAPWVATTGAEGYAAYGGDFTRSGVTSLLLGGGTELLRMGFERPVEVQATQVPGGMTFRVVLGGLSGCELQLAFGEERAQAATLADRAGDAERTHDLGGALAAWNELLDRFPFERKLVTQASEARARLVQAGLNQADELRREMERARFFLLPELFQQGAARAEELARQYQGSEVEGEARKVVEQCRIALTELLAGAGSGDAKRLEGVIEALDPESAPKLREHVREALGSVDRGGKGD
jgi:type III secretion system (T3SS) inner membrane Yop/YscD-like protein